MMTSLEGRMSPLAPLLSILAICAALQAPLPARADDARVAYKKGVALFDDGEFAQAALAFREAYELKPSWKLFYNIGQCEAAAKRYGHALAAFEQYLVEGGDDIEDARRAEVMQEIERMRPLVGMIEVRAPAGATVSIDDERVGTTPLPGPLRVAAKTHHVVVAIGEQTLVDKQVAVLGQTTVQVEVQDQGGPAAETPAVEETTEPAGAASAAVGEEKKRPSPLLIAGIVTGAVGLAGVGVGGYFTYKGNEDYDAYKKAAAQGDADEYSEYKNDTIPGDRVGAIVGFAVGGALVATAATLLIIDAVGEREDASVSFEAALGGLSVRF